MILPIELIKAIDLLCGGGGASAGMHDAGWEVVACLNHSDVAIASHSVNFPGALHLRCDVRAPWAKGNPRADGLWISPACTWHSIANGGVATDTQSRAQAEEIPRYGIETDANAIFVENVKEFVDWGPVEDKLDKNGQPVYKKNKDTGELERVKVPIKSRKGEYYRHWVAAMKATGYVNYEWKLLDAANFGVPQNRVRYFGIFTRAGIPIRWPKPTHHRTGANGLLSWVGVRDSLNLKKKGRSVFNRTKTSKKHGSRPDPLSDKTLRRIIAGLRKFCFMEYADGFLHKRTSNPPSGKPGKGAGLALPAPTLATGFQPDLVQVQYSNYGTRESSMHTRTSGLEMPARTVTCSANQWLLTAQRFMMQSNGGSPASKVWSLAVPNRTNTNTPNQHLVTCDSFLAQYNSGSDANRVLPLASPCNTVPTQNRFGLVSVQPFMAHYYSGGGQLSALRQPHPAMLTNPHGRLVTPVLFQNNGTRANDHAGRLTRSLDQVAPALTTNGGNLYQLTPQAFVQTYYGNGSVRRLTEPCPTIPTKDRVGLCQPEGFVMPTHYDNRPYNWETVARTILASRRHQYVVQVWRGCPQLHPQPGDSVTMRLLKALCRRHGIADIYMRMLDVPELKRIMGFRDDYHLGGTITEQKEMLGNAVCPPVAQALARAMTPALVAARTQKKTRLRKAAVIRWEQGALFGKEIVHG